MQPERGIIFKLRQGDFTMRNYRALRLVATIYKYLAVTVGVLGCAAGVLVMASPSVVYDAISGRFVPGSPLAGQGVGVMLGSVLAAVGLFAVAELIQLLLDMAADLRTTAAYFERRSRPGDEPRTSAHPLARARVIGNPPTANQK